MNRRDFGKSMMALALAGLSSKLLAASSTKLSVPTDVYGPLVSDPNGLLDLPHGFEYRVISELGQNMSDGREVPDRADGMGAIALDDTRIALVRNHELSASKATLNLPPVSNELIDAAYDHLLVNTALPGGTTTILYNTQTKQVEDQYTSLIGTLRNCSGGTTPWGTWLSCEEAVISADDYLHEDHGYVFEVDPKVPGAAKAVALKSMGRFNHEAACVDPSTGIVYLTEDRDESLLYRFIPNTPQVLSYGGRLQALAVIDANRFDTRNWDQLSFSLGETRIVHWIDLDEVESPNDDLRYQGIGKGATIFARGEGIFWGNDELYFCCTSGGAKRLGQIMKYVPSPNEGTGAEILSHGELTLFVESPNEQTFNFGDNVAVAPNGHLIVCEDQYKEPVNNHLKGITNEGEVYDFAKVRIQTEPAGVCFSPDGSTMFVNLYSPTRTLAITGPFV
jgi:hypothetical protein